MINVMNTSAITNQTYDTTTNTACDKGNGFLRRCIAVTLLIMASTATAVGFAATSHADNGAPAPNGEIIPSKRKSPHFEPNRRLLRLLAVA